eukprot:9054960-Pyramimonas_sp.AAC.1
MILGGRGRKLRTSANAHTIYSQEGGRFRPHLIVVLDSLVEIGLFVLLCLRLAVDTRDQTNTIPPANYVLTVDLLRFVHFPVPSWGGRGVTHCLFTVATVTTALAPVSPRLEQWRQCTKPSTGKPGYMRIALYP